MIELLVTTAIAAMLIGLGLFMSMDFYRHTLVNDERDIVVSLLLKARERALVNLRQSEHGVCYDDPNYVLFRGSSYDSGAATNETVAAGSGVSVDGMDCEGGSANPVVFEQLSGDSASTTITIGQNGSDKVIYINDEGRVDW